MDPLQVAALVTWSPFSRQGLRASVISGFVRVVVHKGAVRGRTARSTSAPSRHSCGQCTFRMRAHHDCTDSL